MPKFLRSKPKSGNHTNATQDLYCLVNFPLIFIWKIGIGASAINRAKEINDLDGVVGYFIPIVWAKVPYAYPIEQFSLKLAVMPPRKVDPIIFFGLTETRFIIPGIIFPVIVLLVLLIKYLILAIVAPGFFYILKSAVNE